MIITVLRDTFTDQSVTSEVLLNGEHFCYGIEPPNRPGPKPYCVSAGTYKVVLGQSAHFGMLVPCVQDVPMFANIEIHPGNYPTDTHGCLCVGQERSTDMVSQSRAAFEQLMSKLVTDPDNIQITYVGGQA